MKNKVNRQEELIAGYLSGTANEQEIAEILKWIQESDENRIYFEQLRAVYIASRTTQKKYDTDLSWQRVRARHYKKLSEDLNESIEETRNQFFIQLLKYAAIFILIAGSVFLGYKYVTSPIRKQLDWNIVEAPNGSRSNIILADGSSIWLNAGSTLRYSASFGKKAREVFLEGEAFFNVAKNRNLLFTVHTNGVDIKVLGTQFNVKTYPDENYIQTILVEGSVTLEGDLVRKSGQERILMKPNQIATFNIDGTGQPFSIDTVTSSEIYTSWKENKWIIDREELGSLAVKLGRRYNVKFNILTESLEGYRFTGIIKDETLEDVLTMIKLSAPVNYEIVGNEVNLTANKTFKNQYDEMLIKGN